MLGLHVTVHTLYTILPEFPTKSDVLVLVHSTLAFQTLHYYSAISNFTVALRLPSNKGVLYSCLTRQCNNIFVT